MAQLINKKNILKSIVYRVYSFVVMFLIAFGVTGNSKVSLTLGFLESFFKIVTYYWFDMIWDKFTKKKYRKTILWFTGYSGSGKTTLATQVLLKLQKEGYSTMLLDGDEIRGIFKNYGFDKAAKLKHIADVAKMAVYLQKQGVIPIVSLISPYEEARAQARSLSNDFTEIFVDTPLSVCEQRDVKGLYKKARMGEIQDFTGIHPNAPYEAPTKPEITIHTQGTTIDDCVNQVLNYIRV
ncbi:MAG TPA: adenylyl-sulfate kinase [Bacteroidia bacterium]